MRMTQDHSTEITVLRDLWKDQIDYAGGVSVDTGPMAYVESHFAIDITLERRLRVIDLIAPNLQGRVLEWGCHAGLDSCIYRLRFGDRLELHGCDVFDPVLYKPIYDFSGLHYTQIAAQDPVLDYPNDFFDVVTSNGVLEHVPDDEGSIKEIGRILRTGGKFIVACLPNRYSYTELYQRASDGPAHERLYTLRGTRDLLERHGFKVTSTRRSFMLPTMLNGVPHRVKDAYQRRQDVVWAVNDLLERAWPLSTLASNLMLVAEKEIRSGS